MSRASEKDQKIQPRYGTSIKFNVPPDSFLSENIELRDAHILKGKETIPVFDQTKPRHAMYIALLSAFTSPLVQNVSDMQNRMMQALDLSGLRGLNISSVPNDFDLRKDNELRACMIRFLRYQNDIHHSYTIQIEFTNDNIFELLNTSIEKAKGAGIQKDANGEWVEVSAELAEISKMWDTILKHSANMEEIRYRNYSSFIKSDDVLAMYPRNEDQPLPGGETFTSISRRSGKEA